VVTRPTTTTTTTTTTAAAAITIIQLSIKMLALQHTEQLQH